MVWNLFPFKGDRKFGEKAEVTEHQIWACRGAESPGWFDVLPNSYVWDMMHEWACCYDEAANHQLPIAVAFCIIQIVSKEECSTLMQNLMQIHCSTHSVILNVTATQYTCSLKGIYHSHQLVQWSHQCSHTYIPALSPWLQGCINVMQTVLITVKMTALFLDRPHIF